MRWIWILGVLAACAVVASRRSAPLRVVRPTVRTLPVQESEIPELSKTPALGEETGREEEPQDAWIRGIEKLRGPSITLQSPESIFETARAWVAMDRPDRTKDLFVRLQECESKDIRIRASLALRYLDEGRPAPLPDPLCECVFAGCRSCPQLALFKSCTPGLRAHASFEDVVSAVRSAGWSVRIEDGIPSVRDDLGLDEGWSMAEALDIVTGVSDLVWRLSEDHVVVIRKP